MSYRSQVVHEMLKRASSAEQPIVERLAIAAGLFWRCRVCSRVSDDDDNSCQHCQAAKAPPQHVP